MSTREYFIDFNDPDKAAADTIKMHREGLAAMRDTTTKQEELEWELRLYDFMLLDPRSRLDAYYGARFDDHGIPKCKRDVAKKLGWKVP